MSKSFKKHIINFLIVLSFGLIPAVICQFFERQPVSRDIHIRSFRYGKDPSVIRCNRGDTLRLTFSTDDTAVLGLLRLLYSSFLSVNRLHVKFMSGIFVTGKILP